MAYLLLLGEGGFAAAYAITVPSSVDAGRIHATPQVNPAFQGEAAAPLRGDEKLAEPLPPIPEEASRILFKFEGIEYEGMTALSPAMMQPFYQEYVGKYVYLSYIYEVAEKITQYYRDQGFFLAEVRIPPQDLGVGPVKLQVLEGRITHVVYGNELADQWLVRSYAKRLLALEAVSLPLLEHNLLQLNDLPGLEFRSVFSRESNDPEGGVTLTLLASEEQSQHLVSVDNFSSEFLGPHKASFVYNTSIVPMQGTSFSGSISLPTDSLSSYAVQQEIPFMPDFKASVGIEHSDAIPGYTLSTLDLESVSNSLTMGVSYQALRARDRNLALSYEFEARDSETEALGQPFSEDHVRKISLGVTYDQKDFFGGYDAVNINLSQGLNLLGSSQKGDDNLTRASADPNFMKAEISLSRQQILAKDWSILFSGAGQLANKPLYSSEEFGYGGQMFGRAYDDSDFSGDQGIAGSAELRYDAYREGETLQWQPYVFYDYGMVWNKDAGQDREVLASSFGVGGRLSTKWGQSASGALAFPLGEERTAPIYGSGGMSPRLLLQFSQSF